MTANLCFVPTNLCLDGNDCRKLPCNLADFLDSRIENESLDEFLKKNDFDPEWVTTQEIKGNFSKEEQRLQLLHLTKKSSSWCSSTFSLPWENSQKRAAVTKSFSDIESTGEVGELSMEQFEMFNVSMPELISGHVCQDACGCFCNRKLKQANKLRHVILMCTSLANKNASKSSYVTTPSASLQLTPMSSSLSSLTQLSQECTVPKLPKLHNSFHETSGKSCKSWKFSDDCAIVEIRCAKKGRHRHHSCPMESYRFVSMFNARHSSNAFDPTLLNLLMMGKDLGCEEFISLRRIHNEISVIQLKHSIINKDYSRRKWAKLEERKLVQNFGRIDDITRFKKLEQIDYNLLKLGEKFREDSEAVKQLFNREHGKLIELYSKYENSFEASLDKIDSSNGPQTSMEKSGSEKSGKNCMQSETFEPFMNSEADLLMRGINNHANEVVRVESLIKDGDDDVFREESKNCIKKEGKSFSLCGSAEEQHVLASFSRVDGAPFIRLRSTHPLKNRPLTRYLPIKGEATNFDLRLFIEQGGHCLDLCQEIKVTSHCARGFLKKIGRRLKTWTRKWFVFDRNQKQLCYYSDRSELVLKGRISFQVVEDVYIDNSMLRCANSKATFCLKTSQKMHILSAPSNRARQIWMDVLFTGAEAYQDYLL